MAERPTVRVPGFCARESLRPIRYRDASRTFVAMNRRRSSFTLAGTVLVTLLLAASSAAQPRVVEENEREATEEIKSVEDRSILKRRAWLDTEWNKFKNGRSELEETFGWRWAWPLSKSQDWDVRLEVPLRQHFAGDDPGDSDKQGLGDIEIATGTAFRFNERWRVGGGLELRTPSGSLDVLSDNTWRIQEYASAAWDARPWLTISPSIEYNQSFIEEHGVSRRRFLETFLPVTFLLPAHYSFTARYEARVDFEQNHDVTHSAKFSLNKLFDEVPLNVGVSFEKPFDSNKDFQVNLVLTYYFNSRKEKLTNRILRNLFRRDDRN